MNERTQRTYLLYPHVTDRLKQTADNYNLGMSDLLGYILHDALNKIENGELIVPTKIERAVVDYDPLVGCNEGDGTN